MNKDNHLSDKVQLELLNIELQFVKKHLKWCEDNNKPQDWLDEHIKVIEDITKEIKLLTP